MIRDLAERITRGRRAVKLAKQRGLDTAEWERHLEELFADAGRVPQIEEGLEPYMLWQWRRVSIPEWRRILQASIEQGDTRRATYARWMLQEILLDPEYQEDQS